LFDLLPPLLSVSMSSTPWRGVVLGCGSSASTPKLQCVIQGRKGDEDCVCNQIPFDPRNHRLNPSLILSNLDTDTHVLIDAGKTFRESVLRHFAHFHISHVNGILLTHGHQDAINGLDDVREIQPRNRTGLIPIDIHANSDTIRVVQRMFPYMFPALEESKSGIQGLFKAQCELQSHPHLEPFLVCGLQVFPIPLAHGDQDCWGFIIRSPIQLEKQLVYFSDFKSRAFERIRGVAQEGCFRPFSRDPVPDEDIERLTFLIHPEETLKLLKEYPVSLMFLDALHEDRSYPSHSNFPETFKVIQALFEQGVSFDKVILTGMACTIDYAPTMARVQERFKGLSFSVECGMDGMEFKPFG